MATRVRTPAGWPTVALSDGGDVPVATGKTDARLWFTLIGM